VLRDAAGALDAIFEATLQVLIADGTQRLTTTRVAERAGVSVGTMYQYFPNKRSLVYALNERYLNALADRIEAMCASRKGEPIVSMVEALVDTYWHAKNDRAICHCDGGRRTAPTTTKFVVATRDCGMASDCSDSVKLLQKPIDAGPIASWTSGHARRLASC
jgi:AcrR family transcriptional regulator